MGQRGPQKKSNEQKIAEGVPGGKHKLNPDEPTPDKITAGDLPQPPRKLSTKAKKLWPGLVGLLTKIGVLTVADLYTLARYCDLMVRALELEKLLKNKYIVSGINKAGAEYEMVNPLLNALLGINRDLLRIEQQFGMTPSSRASVRTAGNFTKDETDNFLFGPRGSKV